MVFECDMTHAVAVTSSSYQIDLFLCISGYSIATEETIL